MLCVPKVFFSYSVAWSKKDIEIYISTVCLFVGIFWSPSFFAKNKVIPTWISFIIFSIHK